MGDAKNHSRRGRGERTQRQLRVGELIRHVLVGILARGDLRDPDLAGLSITVTEVRVSPDLRNAAVFVMPLGGARTAEVVTALGRAAPYLRRSIAQSVTMKYLPALSFVADTAFDQSARIDHILRSPDVSRDLTTEGTPDVEDGLSDGA